MTNARQPIPEQKEAHVKHSDPRELRDYAPPKLEKMQPLSQVTGVPILTGIIR